MMQFLMGLSDAYEGIKDQILLMEPLPTVSKVFSMVQRAETQRRIKTNMGIMPENSTMAIRVTPKSDQGGRRNFQLRDKTNLKCSHCSRTRHSREECFHLNGYPEWYQNLKNRKQKLSDQCSSS